MAMTEAPDTPGSQRLVPRWPTAKTAGRINELLEGDRWVLRPSWLRYLRGDDDTLVPVDDLTRDQRIAAMAWLRQQRHRLYAAIDDEAETAPSGWLESRPLYQTLDIGHDLGPGDRSARFRDHHKPGGAGFHRAGGRL